MTPSVSVWWVLIVDGIIYAVFFFVHGVSGQSVVTSNLTLSLCMCACVCVLFDLTPTNGTWTQCGQDYMLAVIGTRVCACVGACVCVHAGVLCRPLPGLVTSTPLFWMAEQWTVGLQPQALKEKSHCSNKDIFNALVSRTPPLSHLCPTLPPPHHHAITDCNHLHALSLYLSPVC